jgi:hypothetical protein
MAGLAKASMIRPAKIATIERRDAQRLGALTGELWQRVEATLGGHLGFDRDVS